MIAPWDRPEPPALLDLHGSARRLGAYVWAERRVFEAVGGWMSSLDDPVAAAKLGAAGAQHAEHAAAFYRCLPELRDPAPGSWVAPGAPAVAVLLDAMAAATGTVERLVGLYRVVLPRAVAAYTFHRNRSATVTDGPTIRVLDRVISDEMDEWREGELVVQSLLRTTADAVRAAAWQAELEAHAVAAGGIAGPGSIGA